MRKFVLAAALMAPLMVGCEMLDETYLIDQDVIIDSQGVRVFSDLEEDMLGSRWWQFRALNLNNYPVCVQVALLPNAQTSGHSMGGIHQVPPGQSLDVGYVNSPATFQVDANVYSPEPDGSCGYPRS